MVNTCGFIDAAVKESLDSIKEAKKKKWKSYRHWLFRCKKKFGWNTINYPEDLGVLEVTGPNNPVHTAKLIKEQLNVKDWFDSEIKNKRNYLLRKRKVQSLQPHHQEIISLLPRIMPT